MTLAFLRRTTLGLLLAGLLPLPGAAADLIPITVAPEWTVNTSQIGVYVAQAHGYFRDAGLVVEMLPYGDTPSGTLVSSGVAEFGLGNVGMFSQRSAGADIKAVYAVVQKETGRIVMRGGRDDIRSPRDLDGKTYGGFGSGWESALLSTVIKGDGGKGEFTTVMLGTGAYPALVNGAIDFSLELATWQILQAELAGQPLATFRMTQYGAPEHYTTMVTSSGAYLDKNPDTARAFLAALTKGYAWAADHPQAAADLMIDMFPDVMTDRPLVEASLKMLADDHYLRAADGTIGRLDPAKFTAVGKFMLAHGILRDDKGQVRQGEADFMDYFTNDFLPQD